MKKCVLYIIMVLTCVSCYVAGYDPEYVFGPRNLESHAFSTLNSNLGDANKIFCLLQSADRYLAYEGKDRDLQWFAAYGRASKSGNRIVCRYGSSNLTVDTNGKTFSEPGAVYKVTGERELVYRCISETSWIVESKYIESELEITSSEPLRLEYAWKGSGAETGDKDESLQAEYSYDINFCWNYKDNPLDYTLSVYRYSDVISRGSFHYSVERAGKQIDWLNSIFDGRNTNTTTSRD